MVFFSKSITLENSQFICENIVELRHMKYWSCKIKFAATFVFVVALFVGCKPRAQSTVDSQGAIDQNGLSKLFSKIDKFLLSIEDKAVHAVRKSLCSLPWGEKPLGKSMLRGINGVSVEGSIDFADILSKGKVPVGVKGGVEVVYWFPADQPDVIERYVFLIPKVSFERSGGSPLGLQLGVISGCNEKIENYSGYFGGLNYLGNGMNFGLDPGPIFQKWFVGRLDSKVPGGVNDNNPITFAEARKIIAVKGQNIRDISEGRNQFSRSNPNGAYKWKSNTIPDGTMAKIMREVRFRAPGQSSLVTDLDSVFKRGIEFAYNLYRSGANEILDMANQAMELTIRKDEDPSFYANVRRPAAITRFDALLEFFWGNPKTLGNLKNPVGLSQILFSISGQLYSGINRSIFKVALNTKPKGTDGPGVGSVKDPLIANVRRTMLFSSTYGCKRQRKRYPGTRWFIVYVNNQKMFFDCYGFGENEEYRDGVSWRIYRESEFRDVTGELGRIKTFFESIEALRFASRHVAIQLHDSFQMKKDVGSFATGGIKTPGYKESFTGCNALTYSKESLVDTSRFGMAFFRDGIGSVKSHALKGKNIVSYFKKARKAGTFGADLSYYYKLPFRSKHDTNDGWPVVRSIRKLKSLSCPKI